MLLVENKVEIVSLLKSKTARCYIAVLAGALLLYVVSCAPGALWQDSGMFQYRIWNNDIKGGLGLALAHPLYHIIGIAVKYIPLGEFGYRINLISVIAAGITVANVFLLLRLWLGRDIPAAIGAVTLAVSWTFWQHGAIAEVYTLYTALFTAELIFLFQYLKSGRVGYLYLLGLFNGLAFANHLWAVIPLACYAVLLVLLLKQKQINIKSTAIIMLLWLIGASSYIYLIIQQMITSGDITGTLISAVFGNSWSDAVLNASVTRRMVVENVMFVCMNFPTPNILFLLTGLFYLNKTSADKRFSIIMLALSILFFLFAFRYTVPDRYAFFIPFYCLASIFIGIGIYFFITKYHQKVFVVLICAFAFLPMLIYYFIPQIAMKLNIRIPTKRTIPYRNDYTYFLLPWQGCNYGPLLFAREALAGVEDDAVIIADGTTVYPLWYYQQINGKKGDVKIISSHGNYKNPIEFPTEQTIAKLVTERPLYVVSPVPGYCPDFVLEHFNFVPAGPLYRVLPWQ